jgi:hypothetical protein
MKSLADALPPEIARQIHPDWRKNEAGYWAMRDLLLGQYQGQWIAFADGAVIAACKTSLEVLHTPGVVERHPFVICVEREEEPYRIRRATFPAKFKQISRVSSASWVGMFSTAWRYCSAVPATRSWLMRDDAPDKPGVTPQG